MPYIKQEKRDCLDSAILNLHAALVNLELDDESNNMDANLNYSITLLLRKCYGETYSDVNSAMGMLSCVAQEHYRTVAAPYEDVKKVENGDIQVDNNPITVISEVVVKCKAKSDDKYLDGSGC